MKTTIAVLFFLSAALACPAQQSPREATTDSPATCELSEIDYAVYSALLDGLGGPEDPEEAWRAKEFLILDKTADVSGRNTDTRLWGFRSHSKQVPRKDTIADFTAKKADRCPLKSGFGDTKAYSVIPASEIDELFPKDPPKRDGWKTFYEKHSKSSGFWQFSRPGYNSAGDEALVYVSHSCGWLCGTGHLYLLSRQSGTWKVKNRLMLWIS